MDPEVQKAHDREINEIADFCREEWEDIADIIIDDWNPRWEFLSGLFVYGKPDIRVKRKCGEVYVGDAKTGKEHYWHHIQNLVALHAACQGSQELKPAGTILKYGFENDVRFDILKNGQQPLSQGQLEYFSSICLDSVRLNYSTFSAGSQCKFCPFKSICIEGQKHESLQINHDQDSSLEAVRNGDLEEASVQTQALSEVVKIASADFSEPSNIDKLRLLIESLEPFGGFLNFEKKELFLESVLDIIKHLSVLREDVEKAADYDSLVKKASSREQEVKLLSAENDFFKKEIESLIFSNKEEFKKQEKLRKIVEDQKSQILYLEEKNRGLKKQLSDALNLDNHQVTESRLDPGEQSGQDSGVNEAGPLSNSTYEHVIDKIIEAVELIRPLKSESSPNQQSSEDGEFIVNKTFNLFSKFIGKKIIADFRDEEPDAFKRFLHGPFFILKISFPNTEGHLLSCKVSASSDLDKASRILFDKRSDYYIFLTSDAVSLLKGLFCLRKSVNLIPDACAPWPPDGSDEVNTDQFPIEFPWSDDWDKTPQDFVKDSLYWNDQTSEQVFDQELPF